MNKTKFVRKVVESLHDNGIKKPVSIPKQVFHISDDEGNSKDFKVRKTEKSVYFTVQDIDAIVDACIAVVEDALRNGEAVTFHGFGSLALRYRKPRRTKALGTLEDIVIDGRYVPKFTFGNDLKACARMYEAGLREQFGDIGLCADEDDDDGEEEDVE